jgi:hypothetical protein
MADQPPRGVPAALPSTGRGPGRLRRSDDQDCRAGDEGGDLRDDASLFGRDARAGLSQGMHGDVHGGSPPGLRGVRRGRHGSVTTTRLSPSSRCSRAGDESSPESSSGSRAITCSRSTSASCAVRTRRAMWSDCWERHGRGSSCRCPTSIRSRRLTGNSSRRAAGISTSEPEGDPAQSGSCSGTIQMRFYRCHRFRSSLDVWPTARSVRSHWCDSRPTTTPSPSATPIAR